MKKSNEILTLKNIKKSFPATARGGEPLLILDAVDLTIEKATSVAIIGKSGSGKSTLLQISAGLLAYDSGTVLFDGKDIQKLNDTAMSAIRSSQMGFIFQNSLLLDDFSALENVQIPAMIAGSGEQEARQKAVELLELVGLGDRLDHKSDQLSGGERQRVAIARALVNNPLVVFADEPTGSLDERNAALIESMLLSLVDIQKVALLLITHDTLFASRCDHVYHLHDRHVEVSH
ncbi:ABC-type antimicrobial peptide transport system, ATPase component [Sphaerochaeta pleomorpha str. Grapes]|uniref:ABC-type antimicrobial peptide transport system, ATPase component n=1 Tax=Sphaerochaeta pleomorpha (strain ATCC BAA-1885 / DSM 22778 / Grapes) TaxID=158190 RepID=G8QW71_SPHPG|nr:ABC transporter ATP-binding protein [Sphaerochaeta pleomorpha]AEV28314.1 ABC-type antimicrobial peptide transport system, ATPase component [Sphaerochaeta pleomorpha str. Grapes]